MKTKILITLVLLTAPALHAADAPQAILRSVIELPDRMIHSIHFPPFKNILLVQERPPLVTYPSPHETYSLKLHTYDLTDPSTPEYLAMCTLDDCKRIGLLQRCTFTNDGTLLFAGVMINEAQEEYLVIQDASDNRTLTSGVPVKNEIRNILFSKHGHSLLMKYANSGVILVIDIENMHIRIIDYATLKDAELLSAIESEEEVSCLLKTSSEPLSPAKLSKIDFCSNEAVMCRLGINPIIENEVPLSAMSSTGLMYLVEKSDGQEQGLFYNMQNDDRHRVPYLFLPSSTAVTCDGTLFAGVHGDGTLDIIDVNSHEVLCQTALFPRRKNVNPEFTGFDLMVESLTFNHDGSLLAIALQEDTVPWDPETTTTVIKIFDLRGQQTAMDQDGIGQQKAKRTKRHPERRWRKKRERKIRNGKLPSEGNSSQ